jgi:hypothetical protein
VSNAGANKFIYNDGKRLPVNRHSANVEQQTGPWIKMKKSGLVPAGMPDRRGYIPDYWDTDNPFSQLHCFPIVIHASAGFRGARETKIFAGGQNRRDRH